VDVSGHRAPSVGDFGNLNATHLEMMDAILQRLARQTLVEASPAQIGDKDPEIQAAGASRGQVLGAAQEQAPPDSPPPIVRIDVDGIDFGVVGHAAVARRATGDHADDRVGSRGNEDRALGRPIAEARLGPHP
jgi:hypothetical protein